MTGLETAYIEQAVKSGKISGNGMFTQRCQHYFEKRYGFLKCLLTTSCTDALEMAALLLDVKQDDEIIVPSFTFVSTANAFVLRGAKIVFVDSRADHPGMNELLIENLVTPRTKAIVVVHYAGVACDMDAIMSIADRHNLFVVEDAAQAIESFYKGKPLGSFGHLSAFSFHETKNIQCGEGGMLVINDPRFAKRAEIIWEKGTNRASFFRGEVDKYGWVDVGSSFLPSEITAAFLWAQLENLEQIQKKRVLLWNSYFHSLKEWAKSNGVKLPYQPVYATNNGHMFYILCKDLSWRTRLIDRLRGRGVYAVFHYQSLHKSPFQCSLGGVADELPMSDYYTDSLVRLPLYYELDLNEVDDIVEILKEL